MPAKDGNWSDQEKVWMREMTRTSDPLYAAEKAGYRAPAVSASQLIRREPVMAEVRRRQQAKLSDLVTLSFDHADRVLRSDEETTKSKTEVMKAVLTHARTQFEGDGAAKELHEMSATELSAFMLATQARIAELEAEAKTIEHHEPAPAEPDDPGIFG